MTIQEAFTHLTSQRGWYRLCVHGDKPLNEQTARRFKKLAKDGKLSESKMGAILLSANYKVKPAQWSAPKN